MPKKRNSPTARDRQLGVMLTEAETEAVSRVAKEFGMSMSSAGRYLIIRGLSVHDSIHTPTPQTGE